MPLFVHIVFWAFFIITSTIGIAFFVYSIFGGVLDGDFEDWIEERNKPDTSNVHKQNGNVFYRYSPLFAVLIAVGVFFLLTVWIAGGFQIASWIYGWGL
jgi:hypothetical protein